MPPLGLGGKMHSQIYPSTIDQGDAVNEYDSYRGRLESFRESGIDPLEMLPNNSNNYYESNTYQTMSLSDAYSDSK